MGDSSERVKFTNLAYRYRRRICYSALAQEQVSGWVDFLQCGTQVQDRLFGGFLTVSGTGAG
jgi:hypothetical protein